MESDEAKKILIVEDDEDYRDLLRQKLESIGIAVLSAGNGRVALDILKENKIDLILLDLIMPEMDGITFCYKLQHTLNSSTPIIIMTNLTEAAYPADVRDFIIKANVGLDEVVKKVEANLSPPIDKVEIKV